MPKLKKSHDIIHQLVKESIDELAAHFLKNPYFFYTENDLHCHLFNIIFKKFESHELNKPIETSDGKSSILLHKEYPTKAQYRRNEAGKLQKVEKGRKGRRGHFDLSVWNPDLVNKKLFRSKGGKGEQETFIAIELALVENNYQAKDALIHTKNDLLKLSDSENNVEYGFMLFFVREWDNRDEFKLIAKKQLTLKEKPTSYYIETKKELLNDFLNKP
tara:strand:+ start:77 stop:727 length:651 start_codon:yes stop_codon:yes gene_type:complete